MVHPSLPTRGGPAQRGHAGRVTARIAWLAALCIALALLAGCTKLTPPPPPASTLPLDATQPLSQSFVAYDPGLVALDVLLTPDKPGDGVIELRLRDEPGGALLATSSLPVAAVTLPGPYRFQLSTPVASAPRDLLVELGISGAGGVLAQTWAGESNPDGTLFRQGEPQRGDLMLQPHYGGLPFVLGWLGRLVWWALLVLAAGALFVLPGWALLDAGWGGFSQQPSATRASAALAVGVAVAPLYLLWTDAAGLHPGPLHAWGPAGLAAAWLGALAWRRGGRPAPPATVPGERWALVALAGVTALLVATRFFLLHRVDVPLWGDSYQHTMIAQLLLDHGGLFDSWRPYVPYETLTVQFGFPAHVALFAWLTGGDSVGMTLVAGQLLNVAAALSLYPLARKLAGENPWAGVAAVLVAGMLSPLPGFYVNWGRYAQLAGQVGLPVSLWLTWALLEEDGRRWGLVAVLGATISGMLLSYYRTAFFYAPFVLLLLLVVALPRWARAPRRAGADLLALAASGAASVALFLPWVLNVRDSSLAERVAEGGPTAGVPMIDVVRADYELYRAVTDFVPLALLLLAAVAIVAALATRRWMLAALAPWMALVAAVTAGRLINMPGSALMQSFVVLIALYIPVSLACAWLVATMLAWAARRIGALGAPLAAAALVGAGLVAAPGQAAVLAPSFVIVTRPDREAMAWIAANTDPAARFLVNGFRIYGGTSAVGADGGWWIPLLAGRANTMPPQYAMLNEQPDPADYTLRVVDLVSTLEQSSPASPAGEAALCAEDVTHVYVGQGQGQVGSGAQSLLSLEALRSSPDFTLVYERDMVAIFAFSRDRCGPGL